MVVLALALSLFGTVNAEKSPTPWEKVNDRTYYKEIDDPGLGRVHVRLWLTSEHRVQFTVITPCPDGSDVLQMASWKEGEKWAHGVSCDSGRRRALQLPKDFMERLFPLPQAVETSRVKPIVKIPLAKMV